MNEQIYPLLENMHVLRRVALTGIRDRAFDSLPLYYENYSDGIVSGCRLTTNRDNITLMPGIVRHGEFMYFLREKMQMAYAPTEEYRALRLKFAMPEDLESMRRRRVELIITNDMETRSDEIELCRFKLKSGAILRTKYTDFFDRVTEFDTVNTVHCPYAAIDNSTLSPDIMVHFAREASLYRLEALDQAFCLAAFNSRPVSREGIIFYLHQRLNIEQQEWDNMTMYQGLCTALKEIQTGEKLSARPMQRKRREVLMD